MQTPPIVPDDGSFFTFANFLVAAIAAVCSAALTALIATWRLATIVSRLNAADASTDDEVKAMGLRIGKHEDRVASYIDKSDRRHEDNINEIHRLANAVTAIPNKQDFQRLEDQMDRRMGEMEAQFRASLIEFKQMLLQASR